MVAHREVGKESAHPAGPPLISAMAAVRAARRPGSAWHRQLPPQEHTSWLLLLMWVPVEHWLAFMPVHLGSLGEWASHRPTLGPAPASVCVRRHGVFKKPSNESGCTGSAIAAFGLVIAA